ncbi:MAG: hypothetical protein ACNA7N_13620, partial [Yoonia sp.]
MSLRFPYLIYLSIASMLVGVIIAPVFRDIPTQTEMGTMAQDMQHGILEVPAVGAPQFAVAVEKDLMDGWNVTITTMNFTFTPEMVNSDNVDNTGHAHLYVNGMKLARLYGPHFHLHDLPEGEHEISVTLSSTLYIFSQVQVQKTASFAMNSR